MRIELAHDIDGRIRRELRKAARQEIGGMLFAEQIAPGHFKIVDFSVDHYSGSHTKFRRDPQVHIQAMQSFFERTGADFSRFNYLGEWHSHPLFPVRPSFEDMQTMTDLVQNSTAGISFALLLIVRLRYLVWLDYSMTSFARGYAPSSARLARRFI
jgi:hypothetical protein